MSAFGIDPVIISENQIQAQLNILQQCLIKEGISIDLNIDQPGLGALLHTLIRTLEKSITTPLQPIIALVRIVLDALSKGLNAITFFVDKIKDFIKGITELIENPFDFALGELLAPIINNINIPFPNAEGIMQIITGRISLKDIDWSKWLKQGKIIIPERLKDKPKIVENILSVFQFNGSDTNAFLKIIQILLMPFKFVFSLLKTILTLVKDISTNLIKTVQTITEILMNPVKWLIDLIMDLLGSLIADVVLQLTPSEPPNIPDFLKRIKELVLNLFTNKDFDFKKWLDNLPQPIKLIIQPVVAFIKIIKCTILWFISILTVQNLIKLFLPDGFTINDVKAPQIKTKSYDSTNKILFVDEPNLNLTETFSIGDKIIYNHKVSGKLTFTIQSITTTTLTFTQDLSNSKNDGTNTFTI
jgi:hypothetical protein